ncbi:hypothetical protein [Clostridium sp.]|nr:hypothetical protein [Clostridium sp.]MDY2630722.1 hypothetical protein [Clostridium sp.]
MISIDYSVLEKSKEVYVIKNDGKIIIGQKSNVVNVKELKHIV